MPLTYVLLATSSPKSNVTLTPLVAVPKNGTLATVVAPVLNDKKPSGLATTFDSDVSVLS